MRLVSGPLTRANVDPCYNIAYGTSITSSIIESPIHAGPTSSATPKSSNLGRSSNSSTLGTP
jgi:hypothetical protein